ncbi:unnamed protein product [Prunus armeniaca]
MIVKFIEHHSADIFVDKVDPSKITYYQLKLAIEALSGEAHGSSAGGASYGDPSIGGGGILPYMAHELFPFCKHGR